MHMVRAYIQQCGQFVYMTVLGVVVFAGVYLQTSSDTCLRVHSH